MNGRGFGRFSHGCGPAVNTDASGRLDAALQTGLGAVMDVDFDADLT